MDAPSLWLHANRQHTEGGVPPSVKQAPREASAKRIRDRTHLAVAADQCELEVLECGERLRDELEELADALEKSV